VDAADLKEIRESFGFFDDWEDKYRFIIDLGKALPHLPEAAKRDENLVRGCQSQVWLTAEIDADDRLHLSMDSDAHIVRGLIAIVLAAYDGKDRATAAGFDIESLFEELDLLKHLSPTRGNGLKAMIGRIRELASG
jgi:cysteine desulfuration protein SufE